MPTLSVIRRWALLGPAGHESQRRQLQPMRDWRVDDPAEMQAAFRQNLEVLMLHDRARIDGLAMAVHDASCRQTRFRSKAPHATTTRATRAGVVESA